MPKSANTSDDTPIRLATEVPSILRAIVIDGPNRGKTLGECILPRGEIVDQRASQ